MGWLKRDMRMRKVKRPIAVFNAGPFRDMPDRLFAYCGGDNSELFRQRLGLPADGVVEVDVQRTPVLPSAGEFSGVIVSGSAAMITDRLPWSERAAAWIAANTGKLPILGVCFGHQLIAHAFGGMVITNPAGSEYGTVEIELLNAAATDELLKGAPLRFAAQAAHSQCVSELPAGAVALARNSHGLQAVRYAEQTWGLQFHPEFDVAIEDIILTDYHDYLRNLALEPERLKSGLRATPAAAGILRQFGAIVAAAEGAEQKTSMAG